MKEAQRAKEKKIKQLQVLADQFRNENQEQYRYSELPIKLFYLIKKPEYSDYQIELRTIWMSSKMANGDMVGLALELLACKIGKENTEIEISKLETHAQRKAEVRGLLLKVMDSGLEKFINNPSAINYDILEGAMLEYQELVKEN